MFRQVRDPARRSRVLIVCLGVFLTTALLVADAAARPLGEPDGNVYYVATLADVPLVEGNLPHSPTHRILFWGSGARGTQVMLDGPGEAYLVVPPWGIQTGPESRLALAVPAGAPLEGRMWFPSDDPGGVAPCRFVISEDAASADLRREFLEAKAAHYDSLLSEPRPGSAWFRHQSRQAHAELGDSVSDWMTNRRQTASTGSHSNIEDSFALLSGGMAVAENLQLDRVLPTTLDGADTVPLDSLQGITVAEYDWTELVAGIDPRLDPLSALVPEDQHALFFPSFDALLEMADQAAEQGTPVLRALQPRAESALTRERYEQQLGLPLSAIARLLGATLIDSVAVTGADPYLRTGADVALLFEAKDVDVLLPLLVARVRLAAQEHEGFQTEDGQLAGVSYKGVRTPDRALCSYVAAVGPAVVVTNSLAQLERLAATQQGELPNLGQLDEYRFFRERYPWGAEQETALLMVSDATIRRWCGPRWRIGTSRRTRAAAVLAELQAEYTDKLLSGAGPVPVLTYDRSLPDVGNLQLDPAGVRSPVYGSLAFQTPVLELDIDRVTEEESAFYERWRVGYQNNWSNFFDPIAVRFDLGPERMAVDVSVRPLIGGSGYQEYVSITQGVSLTADSGDPHPGTVFHAVEALNKNARVVSMNEMMGFARMMAPQLDPLGWVGDAVALYADDTAFWDDLAAVGSEEWESFWWSNFFRVPVALHVEVASGLQLAGFLAGARAFIEQSAPDMTVWETRKVGEESYVRVGPSQKAAADMDDLGRDADGGPDWENVGLFYGASGQGFVLSLDEGVVQRAVTRHAARRAARHGNGADGDGAGVAGADAAPGWLGESLAVSVDRRFVELVEAGMHSNSQQPLAPMAWRSLPILNEYRRLFPREDPVDVYERIWHRRLLEPGGGRYVWNEVDQTMESSLYGHPCRPRTGPVLPPSVDGIGSARFGITFEDDGLRARVELKRR